MVTQALTKTEVLSYAERTVIASVLTWDAINKTFSPDEIEAIKIDGDMVWVELTNGAWPISRHIFRSILNAQRAAINKQLEEVDEKITEVAQPTQKTEKPEKEYLPVTRGHWQATASYSDDWLTEPIGANPDAIFGVEPQPQPFCFSDEGIEIPVAPNGYHDPNWTDEDTEF